MPDLFCMMIPLSVAQHSVLLLDSNKCPIEHNVLVAVRAPLARAPNIVSRIFIQARALQGRTL